ncbi:MAG: class I SAM-dependent methyltransferase [Patescibacteria group bacterium]
MKCKICQSEAILVKTLKVRGVYNAEYYLCDECGFMFVGSPIWLSEAYKEPINTTDTGYVLRNVYLSRKTLVLFLFLFNTKATFLDFAGGYGMLARLMRDYGLDFLTDDAYTPNLFMKGLEYNNQKIEAVTCFECFEHLADPKNEIGKIFSISPNIFFSTVLFSGKEAPSDDWEYYGLNHGQHVSFYSLKTLEYIANKYNVNIYSDGANLHLFTKKIITNWLFKLLLSLTTVQVDLIVRKLLKSKTVSDNVMLVNQENT